MAFYIKKTINGAPKGIPLTTDSGQGLPLGAITAFYGTTPPNGYLICDGSEFSTTDYPALYTFLGDNHTPDLRGEFLRGAGTNSHSGQGDGGSVGQHQDATVIPKLWRFGESIYAMGYMQDIYPSWIDKEINVASSNRQSCSTATGDIRAINTGNAYTTRPTNTSVNFIIKAVIGPIEDSAADQVVQNINNSRSYSTEEVNTGKTWIDGKPIYRKVVELGTVTNRKHISHGITNANIILTQGNLYVGNAIVPIPYVSSNGYITYDVTPTEVIIYVSFSQSTTYTGIIIIEYTKTTDA